MYITPSCGSFSYKCLNCHVLFLTCCSCHLNVLQLIMINVDFFFNYKNKDTDVFVNRAIFLSAGLSWPQKMMLNDLRLLDILTVAFLTQKMCLDWWERYIVLNLTCYSDKMIRMMIRMTPPFPPIKTRIYKGSTTYLGFNCWSAHRSSFSWQDKRSPMLWISSIRS